MDSLEKNFTNLISEQGRIRIPGIQRDYAEGRKNKRVNEIRKLFLNELLKVIYSPSDEKLHLDFVYGYNRDGAFEPLDGQQRLTTLFLLHWFFCPKDQKTNLHHNGKAYLSYATRQSTIDFCNELVLHDSELIKEQWEQYRKADPNFPLSQFIMKLGWFKWQWRYDPSILSMLVVIEDIAFLISENSYASPRYENLQNITFNLLNLAEYNMGDELYVKMNARGKQLSSFDIMKSILEEEIQLQRLAGSDLEAQWRTQIDGTWINYFWQVYCTDKTNDSILSVNYKDVETKVEMQLKRLIQRLICIQFYNREGVDHKPWMIGKQSEFENVLSQYCDLAWKHRTIKKNISFPEQLDFKCLINDLNNLFYCDDNSVLHNATELLDIEWLPKKDIWDEYLEEPDRDLQVAFYAMVAFLRKYSATEISRDLSKQKDFVDWMHFVRNTVLLRNTVQQIDKPEREERAVEAMEGLLSSYFQKGKSMCEFLATIDNVQGLENAILEEERLKCQCRLENPDWEKAINDMENNEYLWAQIIAPLRWSMQGKPSLTRFQDYADKLKKIFPLTNDKKFRAALLCVSNYGTWKKSGADLFLCENNLQRDRSFRSFLRSREANYGEAIKHLIDIWNLQFPCCDTFDDLFEKFRVRMLPQILQDWRRYIVLKPSILSFAYNSKLWYDVSTGHMYLRQKQQSDTQHREIFLAYLGSSIDKETHKMMLIDRYPKDCNSNTITMETNQIRIGIAHGGKYTYSDENTLLQELCSDEVLQKLECLGIMQRKFL